MLVHNSWQAHKELQYILHGPNLSVLKVVLSCKILIFCVCVFLLFAEETAVTDKERVLMQLTFILKTHHLVGRCTAEPVCCNVICCQLVYKLTIFSQFLAALVQTLAYIFFFFSHSITIFDGMKEAHFPKNLSQNARHHRLSFTPPPPTLTVCTSIDSLLKSH